MIIKKNISNANGDFLVLLNLARQKLKLQLQLQYVDSHLVPSIAILFFFHLLHQPVTVGCWTYASNHSTDSELAIFTSN